MQKTLVVMAAGMGSRFGGLKQIEPVGPNGEFIIDYSAYDAKRAGYDKIVFVIKKEIEEVFKETIGERLEGKIKVEYAFQEIMDVPNGMENIAEKREKPWGTVQAVLAAKDLVNGSFVVINADDFYGYDSYVKSAEFLDNNTQENEYAAINFPYDVTASKFGSVKRAVCYPKEGEIKKLIESKVTTMDGYALCEPLSGEESFQIELDHPVAVNMFAFKNNFFQYLEEYFNNYFNNSEEFILKNEALLPELIKEKLDSNQIVLHNIVSNSTWLGMTYREDLDILKHNIQELIKKGEYPEKLWD
ncbi:MAG: nucleotidyltransferase [Bacilli bacterium]|nr:nucleotidyltransferase [Bacilli bacterium]